MSEWSQVIRKRKQGNHLERGVQCILHGKQEVIYIMDSGGPKTLPWGIAQHCKTAQLLSQIHWCIAGHKHSIDYLPSPSCPLWLPPNVLHDGSLFWYTQTDLCMDQHSTSTMDVLWCIFAFVASPIFGTAFDIGDHVNCRSIVDTFWCCVWLSIDLETCITPFEGFKTVPPLLHLYSWDCQKLK